MPAAGAERETRAHVLYAITSSSIGGAELGLARWIEALGDAVTPRVVALKPEGAIATALRERGVAVDCLGVPDGARGAAPTVRAAARLAEVLRRERPDVVHAVLLRATWVAVEAARRAGHPPVVATLASLPRARWRLALARTLRGHARFVAVSESVRSAWAPALGMDVDVIPNGVPVLAPVPEGAREAAARAWPEPSSDRPFRLLAIGRLVAEKGYGDLLGALERVVVRRPDASLLVLGEGPLRRRLEASVRERGLARHVRFAPETLAVRPHLAAADLLVHAARSEGLPTVVLEAMAEAKAVVATAVGGTAEAVRDGVSGLLVPAAAPERLARAILDAIADPARLERMGRAGRALVDRHFSVQATAAAYRALYAKAIAEAPR